MKLQTKIVDSQRNEINYIIEAVLNHSRAAKTNVNIRVNNKIVGSMQYSIEKDHVFIHLMFNTSPREARYKYVGTALFEYAFRISLANGKEGRIQLNSVDTSAAAYFKMGLRRLNIYWSTLFLYDASLIRHLQRKLSEQTNDLSEKTAKLLEEAKQVIEAKRDNFFYLGVKISTAAILGKAYDEVSFTDMLIHGEYSDINIFLEKTLKTLKPDTDKCLRHIEITEPNGTTRLIDATGTMYLPANMIEQKRSQFTCLAPIGTNQRIDYVDALELLKDPTLIALFQSLKLDPTNAVEIENKIPTNDPRRAILLSETGLEMMNQNFISAYYISVYFHSLDATRTLISANGLLAFQKQYIQHIDHYIALSTKLRSQILSDTGIQAFQAGEITLSSAGLVDKAGNAVTDLDLLHSSQIPTITFQ